MFIILLIFRFIIQVPQQPTHFDRRKIDTTENLLPSKEWQEEQVKNFTEVRLKVARHLALVHKEDTKGQLISKTNFEDFI